jgi:hypothetical protein
MRNILARWPLIPFLAAANLIVPLAADNVAQIEVGDIVFAAAILGGLAFLLLGVLRIAVGSWPRASVCAGAVIYVLCILPPALGPAEATSLFTWLLLLLAAGLTGILIRESRRSSADYRLANLILNSILIGYLVLNSVLIDYLVRSPISFAADGMAMWSHRPAATTIFPDLPLPAAQAGPDVWHIVLDRYAGATTLQSVYGFDNRDFLDGLRSRGFSVAEDAAANYQRTAHSLASTLNLSFLDGFASVPDMHPADLVPLYRSLRDNRAARFFKKSGYRLIHVGPWWEPTRRSDNAAIHLNYRSMPELVRAILERSLVSRLATLVEAIPGNGRADQCRRIHAQLDAVDELAVEPGASGRKYVFMHLLLPHPPFVVDADGRCKSLREAESRTRTENYLAQLQYANSRMLTLIDRIAASGRPSVILLQADEGPWPEVFAGDETALGMDVTNIDWLEADRNQLREKMLILLAVKGAAPGDLSLEPRATPVNLYRQLFTRYFAADLPLLPDRSFLFRNRFDPYHFKDVTDQLR